VCRRLTISVQRFLRGMESCGWCERCSAGEMGESFRLVLWIGVVNRMWYDYELLLMNMYCLSVIGGIQSLHT
jgi:hypothetical protein